MTNVQRFTEDKYCVIPGALDPEFASIITQYTLLKEQFEYEPDRFVAESHAAYADTLMETLLLYFHEIVEKNTGLSLIPTYSYYRIYRDGDELTPHTDRPACEISVTLCLGFTEGLEYPIIMDGKSYLQNPGDAIIYRGIDLTHARPKLSCPEGDFQSQVFLHYVDANGPNAEYAFDGRKAVGIRNAASYMRELMHGVNSQTVTN